MNLPTHTIDPEGEVIIILLNANSPFAQLAGNPFPSRKFGIFSWSSGSVRSSQAVAEISKFRFEQAEPIVEKQSGKIKQKKRKEKKRKAAAEEPPAEEPPAEEPPAEEPPAEEPPAEERAAEETVFEGALAELPAQSYLRIQVSAKHLILASPVFKKLLTGDWKESITYSRKGPVEVTADSWDIEALMIVLRAIHGQYYQIPPELTLEMLAKVAVIADYYECREALYFLKDMWIDKMEKIHPAVSRDLFLWLWIAWFFRLPSHFKLSTSIAMSQSDSWIDSLGLPIPENVIGSINECREKAINGLINLLHEKRDAFLHGARGCRFECRSIMYGALTIQMQSNDLLLPRPEAPFPNLNYSSLVQMVLAFKSPNWYDYPSGYSSYGSNYVHRCPDASFASIFQKPKDFLEGLELDQFPSP